MCTCWWWDKSSTGSTSLFSFLVTLSYSHYILSGVVYLSYFPILAFEIKQK